RGARRRSERACAALAAHGADHVGERRAVVAARAAVLEARRIATAAGHGWIGRAGARRRPSSTVDEVAWCRLAGAEHEDDGRRSQTKLGEMTHGPLMRVE